MKKPKKILIIIQRSNGDVLLSQTLINKIFESFNYIRYSESDLKDSLDKEENNKTNQNTGEEAVSEKEERLAKDFQLQRALDLIKGLSLYQESFEK